MFLLRLVDVGASRLRVINTVARILQIPLAQAKTIVDLTPDRITVGDAKRIAFVRRQLQQVGATVAVDYCPEEMHPENWVPANLSTDKVTCARCGEPLFFAIPGRTTEQETVAFAQTSKSPAFRQVASAKWIHPGVYCSNGCCFIMVNLEHPDKYSGEEP
ncbi:ribosomal protein L7/L12 [Tuwongella immobilis]|uniref:Large ribosomal subunit protein bL12 C-terminal domain-containing protein n=1 Tax=Tuwongella immobilis TaxID=692036 RepID=A0A6C2YGZ2_9BACT|nr:ribosomal protein L7/L12 [Tuwongella immobilis]VIP00756.1 50s ribosomal protein l7 l12 : Uncharacterized protein OS=Pseudomonas alcaligenes OT 69 GN=L682_00900 PE=4 SV=1: Ribosomal_L12 [Tuwongella immobilis]VTR96930.1 50s ribosomal protein l7 l12 : Uncharacterized protein OS=Pseudomonas alcaligenes OT 69 GN=L682_00900 PE=4 SV=1: Ribosomal_L12 [Tuwongella immobilis]